MRQINLSTVPDSYALSLSRRCNPDHTRVICRFCHNWPIAYPAWQSSRMVLGSQPLVQAVSYCSYWCGHGYIVVWSDVPINGVGKGIKAARRRSSVLRFFYPSLAGKNFILQCAHVGIYCLLHTICGNSCRELALGPSSSIYQIFKQ